MISNTILLEIAFRVWRLTLDNEVFQDYLEVTDEDTSTIEWYEEFYKYIYYYFDNYDNNISLLKVIDKQLDKKKLNYLLYWYLTS